LRNSDAQSEIVIEVVILNFNLQRKRTKRMKKNALAVGGLLQFSSQMWRRGNKKSLLSSHRGRRHHLNLPVTSTTYRQKNQKKNKAKKHSPSRADREKEGVQKGGKARVPLITGGGGEKRRFKSVDCLAPVVADNLLDADGKGNHTSAQASLQ